MSRTVRHLAASLAVIALLVGSAGSAFASVELSGTKVEAENASGPFDMLIMRPLGLVGLALSAAFWVPAEAITLITRPREWEKPIDLMLKKPARFVFQDPIGSH
jgi:hypothetical protein